MRRWRRWASAAGTGVCLAAAALGFVGSYAAGQDAGTPDPELVEHGRQLYQVGCSSCHGEDAEGTGEGDDAVPSLVGVACSNGGAW